MALCSGSFTPDVHFVQSQKVSPTSGTYFASSNSRGCYYRGHLNAPTSSGKLRSQCLHTPASSQLIFPEMYFLTFPILCSQANPALL